MDSAFGNEIKVARVSVTIHSSHTCQTKRFIGQYCQHSYEDRMRATEQAYWWRTQLSMRSHSTNGRIKGKGHPVT